MSHWYGLTRPEGVSLAFGARMILEPPQVTLVNDRCSYFPEDGGSEQSRALDAWLLGVGLPWLRRVLKGTGLKTLEEFEAHKILDNPGSLQYIYHAEGAFALRASPCQSYGYLFLIVAPFSQLPPEEKMEFVA